MNIIKKTGVAVFGMFLAAVSLTGCKDYDAPVLNAPVATQQANTTIVELKETFWNDDTNYIWGTPQREDATPATVPTRPDGSHYIIKGRVVSSDEAGNVFKSLIIQDNTAALAISINSYNLYLKYRRGQEVVIDVTGMYIGKYNGLLQLGAPEWYANGNAWEASFMSPELFASHVELNGWPEVSAIDTIQVNTFSELNTDLEGLWKWQSQLVRFNNVSFVNGGVETYSEYHSSGVNQSITDSEGQSLIVRTSGYSNFWNQTLPAGKFDLVCIASYYGTTGWQLIMIDADGVMNLGNPTESPGVEDNPWSVNEAITEIKAGRTPNGWVTGYIVGAVGPEVSSVTSNNDIEWTDSPIFGNTLVIGQTADTKDIANALVMELAPNSKLYQQGNLVDNPGVYGKQIWIKGTMSTYLDTYGIVGNNGSSGTWKIEGVEDNTVINDGDGSQNAPYSANQVIAGTGAGTSAWITGYIVGSSNGMSASDFTPGAANASGTNIFIANSPDETDYTKTVPVQLPAGAVRTALNLQSNPGLVGAKVSLYGSLEKYFGQNGIKSVTEYTLDSEGTGGGGDTPTPDDPTAGDGSKTSPYSSTQVIAGTGSGTTAWVAGFIVGSSNGMNASDFKPGATDASGTNIFIANSATETDYTKTVPVQLPSGAVRAALNLQSNPGLVGAKVLLYGSLERYFGQNGLKSVSDYVIEGEGSGGGDTPGTPDTPGGSGTEASPYTCADVIAMNPQSSDPVQSGVWTKGYIVGWADMSSVYYINDQTARFTVPATMATNILLADQANVTDWTKCIGVQLPSGAVRTALNLQNNPDNLGKQVLIKGDIAKYSGVAGIRSASDYKMDGSSSGGGDTPTPNPTTVTSLDENFDASSNIPTGWTELKVAGDKAWYIANFSGNNYASMTGYKGTAPFDSWLITPGLDLSKMDNKVLTFDTEVNGYGSTTSKFQVYVMNTNNPATANTTELNVHLPAAPASGYSNWESSGNIDLSSYSGVVYIGFRYTATADANYATWCLDNVKINAGNGGGGNTPDPGTPDEPETPTGEYKGDFNSFNNGTAAASPYGTYTNATGWTATNSIVLGGTTDSSANNPYFTFIGPSGTLAPTLNGKASAPGKLTSPLLGGGIGTLTFNYGFAFSETKCTFTVYVKDSSGNVVKQDTVAVSPLEQKKAYSYSLAVNYTGNFYIEIVNDCVSQATSNKDRVSIWNLTWTN